MSLLNAVSGGLVGRLVGALPRTGEQTLPITVNPGQQVTAKVTIKNAGQEAGNIWVQLMPHQCFSGDETQQVRLEPGQVATLTFRIIPNESCANNVEPQVTWHLGIVEAGNTPIKSFSHFPIRIPKPAPPQAAPEFVTVEYTLPA